MIKIINLILFLIIFSSCSFNSGGGFWTKQKELKDDNLEFKSIFDEKKKITKEFNKNFKLSIDKSIIKINNFSDYNNNDGYTSFNSNLEKITKYNFSKIKDYHLFDPNLVFYKDNVIFFDNKGSILSFSGDSKLIWKINNYSKEEKKLGPLITLKKIENILIVTDNFAKIYALNVNSGKILWSKKNNTPFNSEIKIFKNKIFVIDTSNNLNCFSLNDGKKIWTHATEKSFINSFKKLSIIVKNDLVVFNNSIGEITALNIKNGSLLWQFSTQTSQSFEEIMSLKTSRIIENQNSIYFSNNKNQFFSVDLLTGTVNWTQEISSDLKPGTIGDLLFTISLDGHLFIIDKNSGNILRITSMFNNNKLKKKNAIYPTGFIFNHNDIFVTTSNGRLIIVDITSGKIKKILKIDNKKISRPFVKHQNMYLIKDNSVIRLN